MDIQPVRTDMLDLLLPLFADCQQFYRAKPDEARNRAFLMHLLATPTLGIQNLVTQDGVALGFSTLYYPLSSVSAQPYCLLNDLYVAPGGRGRGIGKALIQLAREHAASQGSACLRWQTEQSNETAQRLYDRLGATRSAWYSYSLHTGV
jgi:ribosomal protein S18 acetylase RimI-like enzyme